MDWMTELMSGTGLIGLASRIAGKLIFALVVWLAGKYLIGLLLRLIGRGKASERLDPMVRRFLRSFVRAALHVTLLISVIGILGVPMASVVTVLASAGVTLGLAMQGALGNLAGGVMLLIFKPFRVGDYIDAAGASGTVQEVNLFYTVLLSVDNKRITVPNGSLMNANVVNYTAEPLRRVDLLFSCAREESPERVRELIVEVMGAQEKILAEPAAPFVALSGISGEAMEFTARAWCRTGDYWDLYYELEQGVAESLGAHGVKLPAKRIIARSE